MVALATASAAATSTASAECMYRLVIDWILWPSKLAMVGSLWPDRWQDWRSSDAAHVA